MLFGVFFLLIICSCTSACNDNQFQNSEGICVNCRPKCIGQQIKVSECNSTSDIVCRCPKGRFWDNTVLFCESCTSCIAGQVIKVRCSHESNRQCQDCPKGTFANKTSQKCDTCIHCKPGEIVKSVCQGDSNTQCLSSPTPKPQQPTTPTTHQRSEGNSYTTSGLDNFTKTRQPERQTVIIIVVVVCVFFLLAFVIGGFIWCGRHSGTRTTKVPDTSNTMFDDESTDFPSTIAVHPVAVKDNRILLRDISYNIFESLCNLLNPPSFHDWRELAGRLGIPSLEIRTYSMEGRDACQKMLSSWQTQENTTVFVLYNHLRAMQRDDCASLLLVILV